MIFTESLTYDELKKQLDKDDVIAILGCQICARVSGTGGKKQMADLVRHLRGDGFNVKEGFAVNAVCTPKVLQAKLDGKVNTVITMACSSGCSNVSQFYKNMKVVSSCADVGLMSANTKNKTVKVAMPYERYRESKGQVYKMFTGEMVNDKSQKVDGEAEK